MWILWFHGFRGSLYTMCVSMINFFSHFPFHLSLYILPDNRNKNEKIFIEKCDCLNVVRAIVTFPAHRGSIRGCSPVINTRWPGYNPSPSLLFSLPINRPGVGYGFPFDKGAESAYKFRWPRDSVRINIFLTSSFFHPTSLPVRSIANSLEYAWRRGWHTARARGRAPS